MASWFAGRSTTITLLTKMSINEANGSAPQRDMSINRTEDEAKRTQQCINSLAADLAERRARKAAEKAAKEAEEASEQE